MPSSHRNHIVHFLPAPLVLVLGIIASIGGYALIERVEILESSRLDPAVANQRILEVSQEFEQLTASLQLFQDQVKNIEVLDQASFGRLSQSIMEQIPSVSSVEWIERVSEEDLPDFLIQVAKQDGASMELIQYGKYQETLPEIRLQHHNIVRYLNSQPGLERLRGLDRQLNVLDNAIRNNRITISKYRDYALANSARLANVMFAPLYNQNVTDLSPDERDELCTGCVALTFEIHEFASLDPEILPQVVIQELSLNQKPVMMFYRSSYELLTEDSDKIDLANNVHHSSTVQMYLRKFWIGCLNTPTHQDSGTIWPWTILFIGLICTFFSAGIVVANSRRTSMIGIEVEQQTQQLKQVNQQLEAEVEERRVIHEQLIEDKVFLQYLLSGHERDRQLIAFEIHDGVVQGMTAALMFLESSRGKPLAQIEETDQKAANLIRNSIIESRRVMKGLSPPLLEDIGVIAALDGLAGEQSTDACIIKFTHDVKFDRLLPLLECTIYRIVQEGITNIVRHSQASEAEVRLIEKDHQLHLTIQDNGTGFDPLAANGEGFGIKGIQERAKLFDMEAKFQSTPDQGTTISVSFPTLSPGAEKM